MTNPTIYRYRDPCIVHGKVSVSYRGGVLTPFREPITGQGGASSPIGIKLRVILWLPGPHGYLAGGMTIGEILAEHPTIIRADVLACLEYASQVVAEEEILKPAPAG